MATIFIQDDEGNEVRIDDVDVTLIHEPYDEHEDHWHFGRLSIPRERPYRLEVGEFATYQMAKPRRIGQHRKGVSG